MNLRAALGMLLVLASCKDTPPPAACGDLAPPACPEDNGADVCSDPTCASMYACQSGAWTFVKACPDYNPDASVLPVEAGDDGASAPDVPFDVPPGASGGPGCVDLESPDCSLGTALACGSSPGCCDCQDLYVCDSGGWTFWGECTDGGVVATAH